MLCCGSLTITSITALTIMALNCAMLNAIREPIPLPDENIISTVDSGAEVILLIPDTPPEGSRLSGGSGGAQKLKAMGRIWLTDRRVRKILFVHLGNSPLNIVPVHFLSRFIIRLFNGPFALYSHYSFRTAHIRRKLSLIWDKTFFRRWLDRWYWHWTPI